jgi:hypothetical protein
MSATIKHYAAVPGRKVEVYRNLHTGTLSVRDAKTKLVIGHADRVELTSVELRVSEAGRQRAIREGRRNVHAFAVGYEAGAQLTITGERITYNPFRAPGFHYAGTDVTAEFRGNVSAVITPAGVFEAEG